MHLKVNLLDLENGFESPDDWHVCFDRETGEVHTIDDDAMRNAEEQDLDDTALFSPPDWMAEQLALAREVLHDAESRRFIQLPTKWDFHEYRHMEAFIESLPDSDTRYRLRRAIKGRGAFRRFKDAAIRLEVIDEWYAFRQEAIRALLCRWAEEHDLEIVSPEKGT